MRSIEVCLAVVLAACSTTQNVGQQNAPILDGDKCAVHADRDSCAADTGCLWADLGVPCQVGMPCQSGVCYGQTSGSGSGSGSAGTGCACPNGGVCFEQIGGPAQMTPPEVQCTTPDPGTGDPCARIVGEGTCTPSMTVTGLCLCDNGAR